jgi:predicted ATPase
LLSTARLVTLSGAGGSGKTRLAIQVAERVQATFADGAWLVELVPLREPELVPQAVVQVLGLHLSPDQPVLEALLNFVRSKQLLLVLDNCEHLREVCAQLAGQLLSRASELRILATSREPLGTAGERIYPVSGLVWPVVNNGNASDGHVQLAPRDFLQYDAIQLFVERAASRPILHHTLIMHWR